MDRGDLLTVLAFMAFANGVAGRATGPPYGVGGALVAAAGVSALVWAALAGALVLLRAPAMARRCDWAMAALVCAASAVPAAASAWLALTALGLYAVQGAPAGSRQRRGGTVLVTLTVPMFWSPLGFLVLGDWILGADAAGVAALSGGTAYGNAVQPAGDGAILWIAPGCSSLTNVSLAVMCCIAVSQFWPAPSRCATALRTLGAAGSVAAVNLGRLVLIARAPAWYDVLHGPWGQLAANWLVTAVIVLWCLPGTPGHAET